MAEAVPTSPFWNLLVACRAHGLPVGLNEWMTLLRALASGQVRSLNSLHRVGRAIVCRTEADFDAWDVAFGNVFEGMDDLPELHEALQRWLDKQAEAEGPLVDPSFADEDLWRELLKRLAEQQEEHHGGNRWIGTGGTSPFGHSGRSSRGIRVGGASKNRSAVAVASQRTWRGYRTDNTLQTRDLGVALRALRRLVREGRHELDLDETIAATARQGGDIEVVERPERQNQVRVVLLLDSGGSMDPHATRVQALFTAAEAAHHLRSLTTYTFHNCPYGTLYTTGDRPQPVATSEVIAGLSHQHRLIFVGDASMAPYELFSSSGWGQGTSERLTGLEWLRRFRRACPSAVWLNPDPRRWWDHPTVSAIANLFDMHELTLDGLRAAVRTLRRAV